MPFEFLDGVLKECSSHHPIVDFMGGEPLLYSRLGDAVRLASERNVLAVVTTNGLKLARRAEDLVQAELPLLQVSLDGWDESSQEARGNVKGSLKGLIDGVRAVQDAKGKRPFPIIRVLTAITRVNYGHLHRIQRLVAGMGIRYWGISNYFYLNRNAHLRHNAFALLNGLSGSAAAHPIPDDVYLTPDQVRVLRRSLQHVRELNRRLDLRISYAWNINLGEYYSTREASHRCRCDLPYRRLDIHTGGQMVVCVSGKRVGQVGRDSISEVWRGPLMAEYRTLYERTRPMPMCFRCCGLSQTITFESDASSGSP